MFIKQNDSAISDLSNYIVKNNQISSVELFGDMVISFGKPSSFKTLYSSHRDFSYYYGNSEDPFDFRTWNNAINWVNPLSSPSVGWCYGIYFKFKYRTKS
jgi:hypothetical protein